VTRFLAAQSYNQRLIQSNRGLHTVRFPIFVCIPDLAKSNTDLSFVSAIKSQKDVVLPMLKLIAMTKSAGNTSENHIVTSTNG
jgi:hypothetical protein